MKRKILWIVCGLIAIHLLILANLSFTAWPEMLAWPYFILKGWLPYKDFAIVHTPLLVLDISIFYKIFGVGGMQLKIYTWLLIALTDVVLVYVVKKLWSLRAAVFSLLIYIPLQIFYDGNGIWFDYALSVLALTILYLLIVKKYLWAGIVWALAFLTKQTAVWFLLPISLVLLGEEFSKKAKKFLSGTVGILAGAVFVLWLFKVLPDFYFWAIKFGIGILPRASGQIDPPTLREFLKAFLPFSILIPALVKDWKKYFPFAIWAGFGIMGAYPRWELFHFQPGLPFLAIASGLFLLEYPKSSRAIKLLTFLYIAGFLIMFSKYAVSLWHQPDRFLTPSVARVAQTIKTTTKSNEKIFVLNSWDSLYALADRLPATKPWYPQLAWYYAVGGLEDKVTEDLMVEPPSVVIMQPYTTTGLSSFKPKKVTDYVFKYYASAYVIDNSFFILTPNK